MASKNNKLANLVNISTVVGTIMSLLAACCCGVIFVINSVTTTDKRISILEDKYQGFDQKITIIKTELLEDHKDQGKELMRIQDNLSISIRRLEDRLEKIYIIMSNKKVHEVIN